LVLLQAAERFPGDETIVVTAGLFVIPAGYSQNQMTPLMGLLGAVAGYILGKEEKPAQAEKKGFRGETTVTGDCGVCARAP
jgi:hypothetical protein